MYCTCLFVPVYHYLKAQGNTSVKCIGSAYGRFIQSVTAQYYVQEVNDKSVSMKFISCRLLPARCKCFSQFNQNYSFYKTDVHCLFLTYEKNTNKSTL